jgi:pantothenate synthetase
VDYLAITDTVQLEQFEQIPAVRPSLVSVSIFVGETRLSDNIVLNGEL